MRTLNREQAVKIDHCATTKFGISGLVLMENAGRGASDLLCALHASSPIIVCCGKGNNAGDGYVIARHLLARNYNVQVLNWEPPEKITGDARINYMILRAMDAPIIECRKESNEAITRVMSKARWIVDALLGTGCNGAPRTPLKQGIELINQASANRLAVDLPSGLDCNTGATPGVAVRADHTCTFLAPKPGLISPAGKPYVGELHVADLGIPNSVIHAALKP